MIFSQVTFRRSILLAVMVSASVTVTVRADEPAPPPPADEPKLNAPQAVHRGNELLLDGDPAAAIKAYSRAEALAPDAPEVAFVQGLAHYDLKEFDQARDAFRKAATSSDRALADDAIYSLGTCDHAEALQSTDNPKESLSKLESAMRHYRTVLQDQPDHAAARDANFKAASMWRQLKQQQQQQKQKQEGEDGEDSQDKEDQQKQESKQDQESDKDKESKKSESSDDDQQQKDDQDQQSESQDKQDQQDKKKSKEQQAKEQKEQVSREQAERQLREMMQAMRDREKARKQKVQRMPASRLEKDW